MNHIPEEYLYTHLLDQALLSPVDADHLAACGECQNRLAALRDLLRELAIARRSEPSAAVLERYHQLFAHVPQQPGLLTRLVERLRAQLTWDSRRQPALQGLRNVATPHYRQLYTAAGAEIELMVANRASHQRTLEGDIITLAGHAPLAPALVELAATADPQQVHEVQSDAQGRFQVENVTPGHYQLTITPTHGASLAIDDLEIT